MKTITRIALFGWGCLAAGLMCETMGCICWVFQTNSPLARAFNALIDFFAAAVFIYTFVRNRRYLATTKRAEALLVEMKKAADAKRLLRFQMLTDQAEAEIVTMRKYE